MAVAFRLKDVLDVAGLSRTQWDRLHEQAPRDRPNTFGRDRIFQTDDVVAVLTYREFLRVGSGATASGNVAVTVRELLRETPGVSVLYVVASPDGRRYQRVCTEAPTDHPYHCLPIGKWRAEIERLYAAAVLEYPA